MLTGDAGGYQSSWPEAMRLIESAPCRHEGGHVPGDLEQAILLLDRLTQGREESGLEYALEYLADIINGDAGFLEPDGTLDLVSPESSIDDYEVAAVRVVCGLDGGATVATVEQLNAGRCRLAQVIRDYVAAAQS